MSRNNFVEIIRMLVDLGIRKWKICKEFNLEFEELEDILNENFNKSRGNS